MERVAFKMNLLEGCIGEYKKRHLEIWPEISVLLKNTGISDYSIYFDEQTNALFATLKVTDRAALDLLSKQQVMQDWWKYMSDITVSNPDGSPVLIILNEVFHLT